MGFELHITRAEDWTESETSPITLDEWLAYVRSDPEMELGVATATLRSGKTLTYASEGLAAWRAYSGHGRDGNMCWFDHSDGEIRIKSPDEEILEKARRIARALRARVQDDDGQFYDE